MERPNDGSHSADKWIEFDYYRLIPVGGGEDRDPEVIDVCYRYRAQVANPEEGKVIEGKVHSWRYEDDGAQYAIVDCEPGYVAIRTDLYVPKTRHHDYQVRSVTLDEPGRPLAWEVCRRDAVGAWTPIEGQHVRPRTADGAAWLREIGVASDRLKQREMELTEARRLLLEPARQSTDRERLGLASSKDSGAGAFDWQLNEKLKGMDRVLAAVKREINRADALKLHLGEQRGFPVTLMESAIEGRRLEALPELLPRQAPTVTVGASLKMRM